MEFWLVVTVDLLTGDFSSESEFDIEAFWEPDNILVSDLFDGGTENVFPEKLDEDVCEALVLFLETCDEECLSMADET